MHIGSTRNLTIRCGHADLRLLHLLHVYLGHLLLKTLFSWWCFSDAWYQWCLDRKHSRSIQVSQLLCHLLLEGCELALRSIVAINELLELVLDCLDAVAGVLVGCLDVLNNVRCQLLLGRNQVGNDYRVGVRQDAGLLFNQRAA